MVHAAQQNPADEQPLGTGSVGPEAFREALAEAVGPKMADRMLGIMGPLTPEQNRDLETYCRHVSERYIAVVAARAAYRALVGELAAQVGDEGVYDPKQLRPLSNAERAVVLEANPDVINDVTIEPDELVAILRGELDPGEWVSSLIVGPLRKWVFSDVQDQVERNAEIVRQDALDPYQRRGDTL